MSHLLPQKRHEVRSVARLILGTAFRAIDRKFLQVYYIGLRKHSWASINVIYSFLVILIPFLSFWWHLQPRISPVLAGHFGTAQHISREARNSGIRQVKKKDATQRYNMRPARWEGRCEKYEQIPRNRHALSKGNPQRGRK